MRFRDINGKDLPVAAIEMSFHEYDILFMGLHRKRKALESKDMRIKYPISTCELVKNYDGSSSVVTAYLNRPEWM